MVEQAKKEVDPLLVGMLKLAETHLSIKLSSVKCFLGTEPGAEQVDAFCIGLMAPQKGSIMEGITFEADGIMPLVEHMVSLAVCLAKNAEHRMIIPTSPPTGIEVQELVRTAMKELGFDMSMMSNPKTEPDRKFWILN